MEELGILIINVFICIFSFLIPVFLYFLPFLKTKEKDFKNFFINNYKSLILYSFIIILLITRLAFLNVFPGGFNQDEASSAYDAYAIMTTGKDRAGNFLPVHLVAWGSGQNALYSYICIPFIFVFGLNVFAVRIPMGIIGVCSLMALYKFLSKYYDKKFALFVFGFMVISPWHIMKSRWSLESNLFPDLVLIAVVLFLYGINSKKKWPLFVASVFFGISSYAYGTSYFFLFFFCIAMLVYLIIVKKISILNSLICLGIIGFVCLPIMLFIYINSFDKEQMTFLGLTIPKLTENRFKAVTSIFSNDFFEKCQKNFIDGIRLLLVQNDGLPWNSIAFYGVNYIFSFPFFFIGLLKRNKNDLLNVFMKIWIAVTFLMLFIVSPNINRINIVFFPMLYFTSSGIYYLTSKSEPFIRKTVLASYGVAFILFSYNYLGVNQSTVSYYFFDSLNETMKYASKLNVNNIYCSNKINMPYIFALFNEKENVNEYLETRVIANPGGAFEQITSFGKYKFYVPSSIPSSSAVIVSNYEEVNFDIHNENYQVVNFKNYYIVINP